MLNRVEIWPIRKLELARKGKVKKAVVYRMVMQDHICPFGIKSKALLEKEAFEVEDCHLKSKDETERFKEKYQVETTPQTFIEGKRIGGYDDLRKYFGKPLPPQKGETSYIPVVALFGTTLMMAMAISWKGTGELELTRVLHLFGALSMCALAIQKLKNPFSFSNMFLNYDLLSNKVIPYSYAYPAFELIAGIGMLAGAFPIVTGSIAIAIGLEGAVSVTKAVFIDKRSLKCACMGGDSNVPLGFVSLLENILMIIMGVWVLSKSI